MSHSWSYFSHQNGSFLFSHKDLTTYWIKAPVRWGVNATKPLLCCRLAQIKAPVRWGVNFKITPPRRSKPGVGVG